MKQLQRVVVVGGSTASGHSIDEDKNFGYLTSTRLDLPLHFYTSDLAKMEQLNEIIESSDISKNDLVLILAGIGDSWPQPQGIFQRILPPSWRGAGKMNPASRMSRSFSRRIRQRVRHFLKFSVKLFFWILGYYRPDTNKAKFSTDVSNIIQTIQKIGCPTIWLFPQKPRIFSTFIELSTVRKYISIITNQLEESGAENILAIDINSVIDDQADILGDGLHLAESGHEKVAQKIVSSTTEIFKG
ncbi:MAG: hypothetical protein EBS36_00595 [Actinobacteria bacterium]|nr:hypothetical protein [Actinomycetota bacterium]NBY15194.1 hypothetical protein [Actinomycetota bacterium]